MRKKIGLLLVLIVGLFVFSGDVEALAMYLECDYGSLCDNSKVCDSTYYTYYTFTNKNGSLYIYMPTNNGEYYTDVQYYDERDLSLVVSGCWFESFDNLNQKCKNDDNKLFSKQGDVYNYLWAGNCPAGMRKPKDSSVEGVFAGESSAVDTSELIEPVFVAYSYTSDHHNRKGDTIYVIEAYTSGGKYAFVNANEIPEYGDWKYRKKADSIQKFSAFGYQDTSRANYEDYWKVDDFYSQAIYAHGYCDSESQCEEDKDYELIFDSNDSTGVFKDKVKAWYDKEFHSVENVLSELTNVLKNEKFINIAKTIDNYVNNPNGKIYEFSDDYSVSQMINDLDVTFESLSNSSEVSFTDYSEHSDSAVNPTAMASLSTYFWTRVFDIERADPSELLEDTDDSFQVNINEIRPLIDEMLSKTLEEIMIGVDTSVINIMDIEGTIDEYTRLFLVVTSYLDKYHEYYELSLEEITRLNILRGNYELFAKDRNIYAIVDCEGLLGQDLVDKINSYLDIVKIVVPIILIGFGVFDFTKAIFGGQDDMKKAQKTFVKRLLVAFIIFLTPTLLNFLLTMANKVWPIIEPSTCGIGW